jgi:hypothetical protein
MSKLTPTTVILIIAGLGALIFLLYYFKSKKTVTENTVPTTPPLNATGEPNSNTLAPNRLVNTPVGYILNR